MQSKEPAFQMVNRFVLLMNPPEHTLLRALVGKAFSVKQAPELRRLAQRETDRLIDGFVDRGCADLVRTFAYPLPVRIIGALLDIPPEDGFPYLEDAQALVKVFVLSLIGPSDIDAANRAAQALERHAGHETTANMIGNALLTMFRPPEQLALLRANPSLPPRAVNECLRYETSVHIAARVARQDVAIGTVTIKRGETVYINLAAANRDPAVFEQPERFLIERPEQTQKPQSFGGGMHYCLGARLARIELETALGGLLRSLPELRLEGIDDRPWKPTITIRGLDRLPARWQTER